MDKVVEQNLKSVISSLYAVCDSLEELYDYNEITIREILKLDYIQYALYLSVSDEEISEEEADFINEYFGLHMTMSELYNWINEKHLHSEEFLEKTPLSFKIFVDIDNKVYQMNPSIENICDIYMRAFQEIGQLLIESNDDVVAQEKWALSDYIGFLRKYYEKNTVRRSNKVINIEEKDIMDDNIRINVNNRTITIPRALPETVKRMQELISLRDEMVKWAEKERDNYDPDDSMCSVWDCYREMYKQVEQYNEKYELKLKNEYGITMFASFSEYMKKYYEVCESAEQRIVSLYKHQIAMRELGSQIAEQEALREIKGMPFGIITNSITSVLLYNGMATINHASQVKRAEQTYNRLMAKYDRNEAAYGEMKILTEEIFPLIYPVSEKTTAIFLDDVLKIIDAHEQYGYSSLKNEHKTCKLVRDDKYVYGDTIALRKAMNDLQRIGDSEGDYDKVLDILEQCPYCPEIYIKLIKIGKFDKRVFEIAKIMYLDKMILPKLEEEVTKRKANISEIKPILEIIAVYKSQSFEQVLKNVYQSSISRIKNDYHELFLLCTDSKRLHKWIEEKVNSDMDKVVVTSEEDVRNKVHLWLRRNVEDAEFTELSNMGLITIEDIRMKDSTMMTLEDVKSEYADKMISRIMEYIKEASVRKVAYEEAYEKFKAELKKKSDALDSKMAELKQQGMFAFSKKKEIKAEIEHLQRELEDFRKTEPVKLREAYYGMYA